MANTQHCTVVPPRRLEMQRGILTTAGNSVTTIWESPFGAASRASGMPGRTVQVLV